MCWPRLRLSAPKGKIELTKPLPPFTSQASRSPRPLALQQATLADVRRLNGCTDKGTEWAPGCTSYPSKGDTPLVTFIHPGGHVFPKEAPALFVRFFQEALPRPPRIRRQRRTKSRTAVSPVSLQILAARRQPFDTGRSLRVATPLPCSLPCATSSDYASPRLPLAFSSRHHPACKLRYWRHPACWRTEYAHARGTRRGLDSALRRHDHVRLARREKGRLESRAARPPSRRASRAYWPRRASLPTTNSSSNFVLCADHSGVFLRTPAVPTDPAKDCYELNIADPETSPFYTGSFVGRQKATEYLHSDDWQSFDVGAGRALRRQGRWPTGARLYRRGALGRGRIGLQLNKGAVAFRNIKLRPLGLESIFNGRDLTGWKVHPDKKSVFTVTPDGDLNVKNGNGQIETEGQWADFVLQVEIFSNGKYLNSGIFFRTVPGGFWQGYESQIQNGFLLDRTGRWISGLAGSTTGKKLAKSCPTISSGFTRRWLWRAITWPLGQRLSGERLHRHPPGERQRP